LLQSTDELRSVSGDVRDDQHVELPGHRSSFLPLATRIPRAGVQPAPLISIGALQAPTPGPAPPDPSPLARVARQSVLVLLDRAAALRPVRQGLEPCDLAPALDARALPGGKGLDQPPDPGADLARA